jgi:zinc transport system ATP-binding protein
VPRSTVTDRPAALELRGGWVRLGGGDVLRGIDFHVAQEEFVLLLGPNGSGKTTLVRALVGLTRLARGERYAFGEPLERLRRHDLIGYVPQRVSAAARIPATVEEVVISGLAGKTGVFKPYGESDRAAVRSALDLVDLAGVARARVDVLSGGQQQRVLIARALAINPSILVMDEPLASVDLAHQDSLAKTLAALNKGGTAILLVAHALGAMEPLAHRAVVLEGGKVIYDGPTDKAPLHVHPHHHEEAAQA